MLSNLLLKTLRDQRSSLLFWGIGLVTLALLVALFYPTINRVQSFNQYLQQLPEGMKEMFIGGGVVDYTSPVGYFSTELFSFMPPLLLLVFGIGFGASAIAGGEEKGALDFLLTNPLQHWRVVTGKFNVMLISLTSLGFVFWAGLGICVTTLKIDISLFKLAEATMSALLLAMVFAILSFFLGCLKRIRNLSLGLSSGLAVLTYLLQTLESVVNGLKPYRFLPPFYHICGAKYFDKWYRSISLF